MLQRFLAVFFLFVFFSSGPAFAEDLSLDRLFGSPDLDGEALKDLKISPDGARVTYLKGKKDNARQLDLWEYNIALGAHRLLVDSQELLGGEEVLSEEEKSRRNRMRIIDSGIVSYGWDAAGKALIFPLGGDVYYKPLDGPVRQLTATEAYETDIKVSPAGHYVSFIRDRNLYMIDLATGEERQLTFDGGGAISNGIAEFVAQEEMDRFTGYWWAKDDSKIAFERVDESPVDIVERYEIAADGSVTIIRQRYPRAGTANVLVTLGVLDLGSGAVSWIDLGPDHDIYLTRVKWLPDSEHLTFQRESRDQKTLDLILVNADGSGEKPLIREAAKTWINLTHDLKFIEGRDEFLWTSERSGFRHIYVYGLDGTLKRQLTDGDWVVSSIAGYDPETGMVLFEGFRDTVLEKHLYTVPIDGGDIMNVTEEGGWHSTVVPKKGKVFIDKYSSDTTPPRTLLKAVDGTLIATLTENPLDETHPYYPFAASHATREFGTTTTPDGTVLHYSLMKPADFDPSRKYPAIVFLYGGPGVTPKVRNDWNLDFPQFLARNGYLVFTLDNRGTPNRGKAFEDPIYRAMGGIEVEDQAWGAEVLKAMPFVDENRVGIYGWSYGGYMTLNMLLKKPGLFAAGFSGAPVTDWRLYDTHYTERYMGDPNGADAEAYEKSGILPYVDNLKDKLLLIHGMADDNVLFSNSVRLIAALEEQETLFEFMAYPGERHHVSSKGMEVHVWLTVFDFFERNLKGD